MYKLVPAGERGFGSEHSADLALHLGAGLPNQTGVVDQSVLRSVVLGLEGLEKLRLENVHRSTFYVKIKDVTLKETSAKT